MFAFFNRRKERKALEAKVEIARIEFCKAADIVAHLEKVLGDAKFEMQMADTNLVLAVEDLKDSK
jgi:hypothetical protein